MVFTGVTQSQGLRGNVYSSRSELEARASAMQPAHEYKGTDKLLLVATMLAVCPFSVSSVLTTSYATTLASIP